MGCTLRLSLAIRLKRMNQSLGANLFGVLHQQLGTRNLRPTAAEGIAHRFFAGGRLSIPKLMVGRPVPSFHLLPWTNEPYVLKWLQADQATAITAFQSACQVSGSTRLVLTTQAKNITVAQGCQLMRAGEFDYANRWRQPGDTGYADASEGMALMRETREAPTTWGG